MTRVFVLHRLVNENSFQGIEIIFRMGIALLEIHQDHLMLLSMDDMLKVCNLFCFIRNLFFVK